MNPKKTHPSKGFTLVELLVVIAIIAGLAAISTPVMIRQLNKARATNALSNAKDIYIGVRDAAIKSGGRAIIGPDATAAFDTLFSNRTLRDEKPFFVKGTPSAFGSAGNEDNMLVAGENIFSLGVGNATIPVNIVLDSANTPLIICPVQAGPPASITAIRFEDWYGSQTIVLTSDGSGSVYPQDSTGAIANPANGMAYLPNTPSVTNNPWSGLIMKGTPTEALADTALVLPY